MTIRTPDQRLRVFISSDASELSAERAAARRAVENLRLSPVVLDVAARAAPPRQLYAAYVEQSHVFIAIYGESYGWVGPEMSVSVLEDQYDLANDKPKLIYVKRPAPHPQQRLTDMLGRIKRDARVSYKSFHDPAELQQLVENDLAHLLTEHFRGGTAGDAPTGRHVSTLPGRRDHLIGREQELRTLIEILTEGADRLVTLTGPGGVGKTRLALEAATRCAGSFEGGAHMVALGSVSQAEVVIPTIVQTLSIQGSNVEPLVALIEYLRPRHLLLVLDNLEQVIAAGPDIARIIEQCARVEVLVTSRALLNLRPERDFPVGPLAVPVAGVSAGEIELNEAVRLFVDRARAIRPGFEITDANAPAIATICRRLDGLPLALELAAARTRVMDADSLLKRLESSLRLLTRGARDAPERHQTLRAAIDWSFGLLNDDEQALFVRLGAFRGGCTLEAAERVCNAPADLDVLELMGSLLDKSLIKQQVDGGAPRFAMLQTVWDYADERLNETEDASTVRSAHADYFLALVSAAHEGLRSSGQVEWLERLETDHDNLRAAMRWSLDNGAAEAVAEAGWTLWLFWWLDSHLAEGRTMMRDTLAHGGMSELARARATAVQGVMAFWQSDYGEGVPLLASVLEVFRAEGEMSGVALCQLPLGFVEAATGAGEAGLARLQESVRHFKETGDEWGIVISMNALCWTSHAIGMRTEERTYEEALERARNLGTELDVGMALRNLGCHRADQGRVAEAKELLVLALQTLWRGYVRGGTTYTIDGIAEVAAAEGAHSVAARLFAATEGVREATQSSIIPMYAPRFRRFVDELRRELGATAFDREWKRGRELRLEGAAQLGLAWARGEELA